MDLKGLFEALKNGGFTYPSVEAGFALSPYKDREEVVEESSLTVEHLARYSEANSDLLSQPNTYFGAWLEGGKAYLDCSVVLTNREEAEELCRKNGQLAYFDLSKKETVRL